MVFFIWSSVIPWASHPAFTMNQNWSQPSFPTPLNTGSFRAFAILNSGGGGSGVGDGVSGRGEDVGGVDGWDEGGSGLGIRVNPCLIN